MILFLAMAASVGQSHKPAKLPPIKPIDLKTVPHVMETPRPITYPPLPVTMVPSPPPAPPIARQTGPNLPPQPANPQGNWIVGDDYPSAALRDEVQGEVVFSLAITKWGTLADCTITKSSDSAILDEATCRLVMRRARFYPATDKDMKPVAGTFSSKVKWVLPEDTPDDSVAVTTSAPPKPFRPSPPYIPMDTYPRGPLAYGYDWPHIMNDDFPAAARAEKREGTTLLRLGIGVKGDVTNCTVASSSGHNDLDAKSCEIAKTRFRAGPARGINGEEIAGRVDTGVNWYLSGEEGANLLPPPVMSPRQPLFERSGIMTLRFHQDKDGSLQNCQYSMTGLDGRRGPGDDICAEQARAGARPFRPYIDDKGNPVARDVSVELKVRVDPPKGK